jgi:hypothetical protein
MVEEVEDPRKRLAFEESIRALTLQSAVLDDLRSRTGILLTAASLTATFVGSRALDEGFSAWTLVALALFLATGGFCLRVLWPSENWQFSFNARTILDGYVREPDSASLNKMLVEFAEFNQENWDANNEKLSRLFRSFRLAVLALVLQVLCWLMAIGMTHG